MVPAVFSSKWFLVIQRTTFLRAEIKFFSSMAFEASRRRELQPHKNMDDPMNLAQMGPQTRRRLETFETKLGDVIAMLHEIHAVQEFTRMHQAFNPKHYNLEMQIHGNFSRATDLQHVPGHDRQFETGVLQSTEAHPRPLSEKTGYACMCHIRQKRRQYMRSFKLPVFEHLVGILRMPHHKVEKRCDVPTCHSTRSPQSIWRLGLAYTPRKNPLRLQPLNMYGFLHGTNSILSNSLFFLSDCSSPSL
ncbi:hypothetical protein B0H63DRAFT_252840 [Podospora didyma]|uniref:Uncharacterized protein n=1 Tax=Podospora didyma TaxID=330526 RepID=A0AAE0KD51_9PEZI|nr:hypothetical protein B0H63DRAFT_252840 [Podospora didyma]